MSYELYLWPQMEPRIDIASFFYAIWHQTCFECETSGFDFSLIEMARSLCHSSVVSSLDFPAVVPDPSGTFMVSQKTSEVRPLQHARCCKLLAIWNDIDA
jgi:hypothetical protein